MRHGRLSCGWSGPLNNAASQPHAVSQTRALTATIVNRYSQGMKDSKRATVYFDPEFHRALSRKAAKSHQSISHVVNEAVRLTLAEDSADLKAFHERASEKNLDFGDVVKSFKRRGTL